MCYDYFNSGGSMVFDEFRKLSYDKQKSLLSDKNFVSGFAGELSSKDAQWVYRFMLRAGMDSQVFYNERKIVIDEKFLLNRQNLSQEKPYELMNLIAERFLGDSVVNVQLTIDTILEFVKDCPEMADKIENLPMIVDINNKLLNGKTCEDMYKEFQKYLAMSMESGDDLIAQKKLASSMQSATFLAGKALIDGLKLPDEDGKFAIFTHTHRCKSDATDQEILQEWDNPSGVAREEISLCYISDKNPRFFPASNKSVTFGFLELGAENIKHISPTNSYSLAKNVRHNQGLFSPQTFAEISYNYIDSEKEYNFNEIVYRKPKGRGEFMPSVIISQSDTPTELEEQYARAFGVPILHINPLEYMAGANLEIADRWQQEVYRY